MIGILGQGFVGNVVYQKFKIDLEINNSCSKYLKKINC